MQVPARQGGLFHRIWSPVVNLPLAGLILSRELQRARAKKVPCPTLRPGKFLLDR